jgi:UDP-N-acetyl-D-mannosaminuronate dehydrogenase
MDVPVLVLGAAYRGGVKETAFSGGFGLVDALRLRGAVPFVSDPMFSRMSCALLVYQLKPASRCVPL